MYNSEIEDLEHYFLVNNHKFVLVGFVQSFSTYGFYPSLVCYDDNSDLIDDVIKDTELHSIEEKIFENHSCNETTHKELLNEYHACLNLHHEQLDAISSINKGTMIGIITQILSTALIFLLILYAAFHYNDSIIPLILIGILVFAYASLVSCMSIYRTKIVDNLLRYK